MAPSYANQDWASVNNLLNAGGQAQTLGNQQAAQNYQWWSEANQYPIQRLGVMGNALNLGVQSGQQNATANPSQLSSGLGGALVGSQIGNQVGLDPTTGALLGGLLGYFGG
jgi:hypothetical protein